MIPRRSIIAWLAILFGLAGSGALVGLGLYQTAAVKSHFAEGDMVELKVKLDLATALMARTRSVSDFAALSEALETALGGHHQLEMRITRANGEVIFPATESSHTHDHPITWPEVGAKPDPQRAVEWESGGDLYRGIFARRLLGIPGEAPATVAVAFQINHHRDFVAAFQNGQWLATVVAITLTAVLSWSVARLGLAPLRRMSEHARGISAARLHDRLDTTVLPVELVGLAQAFNGMLARLEDSFVRLSDFSSDLAHELRTPVSNLMTQTQVALGRHRTADEYREVLYSNLEELERMSRMIADMLFLAKADNGMAIPNRETVNLAAMVRELFDFYEALAEEKRVALKASGSGSISGDRLMLRRALSNLLSNAIRHTPPGGVVEVRIATDGDGRVHLSVENPGPAIPAEHLPHLFERFYRAEASRSRSTEGFGLGLAITRSIVQAHHGTIGVESAGDRTCFRMSFV